MGQGAERMLDWGRRDAAPVRRAGEGLILGILLLTALLQLDEFRHVLDAMNDVEHLASRVQAG